jgi:hypothetical protein
MSHYHTKKIKYVSINFHICRSVVNNSCEYRDDQVPSDQLDLCSSIRLGYFLQSQSLQTLVYKEKAPLHKAERGHPKNRFLFTSKTRFDLHNRYS